MARIVDEISVIRSFRLEPDDDHGVPPFESGQHLPIRLTRPMHLIQVARDDAVRVFGVELEALDERAQGR